MCLSIYKKGKKITIDDVIKIAKEDIVVYKRLRVSIYSNKILTPYQSHLVDSNGDFLIVEKFTESESFGYIDICKGIHSYSDLETAERMSSCLEIIVKSIIPKDTPYIKYSGQILSLILIIPPLDGESVVHSKQNLKYVGQKKR